MSKDITQGTVSVNKEKGTVALERREQYRGHTLRLKQQCFNTNVSVAQCRTR